MNVAILPILLSLSSVAAVAEAETRVYSDVRHIAEVDDYVGTEIILRRSSTGSRFAGQWDLYEGYDALSVPLEGSLVGSRLEMKGTFENSPVVLTAALSDTSLRGTLKWYIGGNLQTRKIRLHRVPDRLEELRRRGGVAAKPIARNAPHAWSPRC